MNADSKVKGLLHSEQLALHDHLSHPHRPFTHVMDGHKPSKEEAPSPCLQKQDPLHTHTSLLEPNQLCQAAPEQTLQLVYYDALVQCQKYKHFARDIAASYDVHVHTHAAELHNQVRSSVVVVHWVT